MVALPKKIKDLISSIVLLAGIAPQPAFAGGRLSMQPGFDPAEYNDLMQLDFVMMHDTMLIGSSYQLNKGTYKKIFRSPEVGLYNRFEVYTRNGNTAVITIRGTVAKAPSWLENFYMAMVKANGSLQLNDSTVFNYRLAADSQAAVHAGWLTGLASMAPYINSQLNTLFKEGITDVVIMGHSQGAALAFLTTSYCWYQFREQYPGLRLKTYASGAPKPGNLYYAYDFDHITRQGYGFRIVNTADWVPETPFSIQTVNDFNEVNPLTDAKRLLRRQKFPARLLLVYVYNQLNKGSLRAMKRFRKYLGSKTYQQVTKSLPQLRQPYFQNSINYMPAGSPVILVPDSVYQEKFKFDGKDVFIHHMMEPYLYLLGKLYPGK